MVEIAKSFSLNAKILILDEPTSSLSEKEVDVLFDTVRDLKKQGMGIIFITHKMAEVFQLCDAVTYAEMENLWENVSQLNVQRVS